jgi:toxin ParE1/3/4
MKLVFTEEAKFDLDDIGDWIADHDPLRAVTFIDELTARCAKLTGTPHACPLVPFEATGVPGGSFTGTISSSIASSLTRSKSSV